MVWFSSFCPHPFFWFGISNHLFFPHPFLVWFSPSFFGLVFPPIFWVGFFLRPFLVWSGLVCSQDNFSSLGLALLVLLDWRLKASDRVLHLHNLSQAASEQNLQCADCISPNNIALLGIALLLVKVVSRSRLHFAK